MLKWHHLKFHAPNYGEGHDWFVETYDAISNKVHYRCKNCKSAPFVAKLVCGEKTPDYQWGVGHDWHLSHHEAFCPARYRCHKCDRSSYPGEAAFRCGDPLPLTATGV